MEARKLPESGSESFQFSLRIRHPSIDPAELSRALNVEPEHAFAAGTPRRGSRGGPAAVHSDTYWLGVLKPSASWTDLAFSSDDRSRIAPKQATAITRNLSWSLALTVGRTLNGHGELLRRIRAEGGEVTLLVTVFSAEVDTFSLTPQTARLLGELGVAVEFEIGSA